MDTLARTPASPSAVASSADPLATSFATSYAGVVAFLAVVSEGSFARAGDRLGIGRSAVSRNVQKLEAQLGARLFVRTTRSTSLTREGETFFQNCSPGMDRITQAIEDMHELRSGPPRGHLRVRAATGFGRRVIAPMLGAFHARYPDISLDFQLDDRPADFTSDRVDVAFRDGRMEDSQVIARQLIPMQLITCASPDYARAHGLPATLDELAAHRCVMHRGTNGRITEWEFKVAGRPLTLAPSSRQTFNDADLVLQSVLAGHGIAQLAAYQACEPLRDGRLVACLGRYAPADRGHYVCYLSRKQLPSRIRVFIDEVTERTRALDIALPFPL